MRARAALVVGVAFAALASAGVGADVTRLGGVAINDTEAAVRAALAPAECRAIRTRLSRTACSIRTSAWGAPVLAIYAFHGEPQRLVIIALSFDAEHAEAIERALVGDFGPPDSMAAGDPYWTRADAVVWIERQPRRVLLARRDHVGAAGAPARFPCSEEWPEHVNARLNCAPQGQSPSQR